MTQIQSAQLSPIRAAVPSRGAVEGQLEQFKARLLAGWLAQAHDQRLMRELFWAAQEATALAWYTAYPLLMLPVLLEEKMTEAWARWERQQHILRFRQRTDSGGMPATARLSA